RMASAYALAGRGADALPLLAQSEHDLLVGRQITYIPAELIRGYLEVGRLDEALDHALSAHDAVQSAHARVSGARVLHLLGDVVSRREEHARAEIPYRQALALADELGMRP